LTLCSLRNLIVTLTDAGRIVVAALSPSGLPNAAAILLRPYDSDVRISDYMAAAPFIGQRGR